jgi:hypothetical protein
MIRLFKAAAFVGAVLSAGALSSPAPAARGQVAEHHVHGVVVAIHHGNGVGTLTIHTPHHNAKVARGANHTFTITRNTQVHSTRGGFGPGALRVGEHVTVAAHHHHADRVTIHR